MTILQVGNSGVTILQVGNSGVTILQVETRGDDSSGDPKNVTPDAMDLVRND